MQYGMWSAMAPEEDGAGSTDEQERCRHDDRNHYYTDQQVELAQRLKWRRVIDAGAGSAHQRVELAHIFSSLWGEEAKKDDSLSRRNAQLNLKDCGHCAPDWTMSFDRIRRIWGASLGDSQKNAALDERISLF
jgi:hypothetical protein